MNKIKISVIMPSLNVKNYIRECVESVINQTIKEIEVIRIDAGSTDGTLEILQEYASRDKRIKIIHSDKKSYGFQMNIGIKTAKGEYIGIVETDDFIDPNMYEELYGIAKETDVDFVKEDYRIFIEKDKERIYIPSKVLKDETLYENKLVNKQKKVIINSQVVIWSSIYKREFILNNNIKFNETPGASFQDSGFWFITSVLAKSVYFHNNAHYFLRRDNPNSSVASKDKVYCICDEYDYILNFLKKDSERYNEYIGEYWNALFYYYLYTLKRIDDKYKKEFILMFSQKLKEGLAREEIDTSQFKKREKKLLLKIAYKPTRINLKKQKLRPTYIKEATYIQRLKYCYEDNGTIYTINHIFNRIISVLSK